ncbi:anti-phage dCTP deaminase [Mucilaginibacter sp. NFR10]|uniref:anti-phage dCTP deaminase n=1 Tax=Mucilaginibacter sp. NFR10 TaxID=1566292 RepID=UPI0008718924|nr:anti-phage dCTP deaminase [Mucilaginibacter sp. NFR10]SCW71653.1 Deoxycytidylate deaminase [Mucilaginibacter sp. NFR10]
MSQVSLSVVSNNEPTQIKSRSTSEKIENTLTEELIIGICAPIGSSREIVIKELRSQLENEYGYTVHTIKLSDLIVEYQGIDAQPVLNQTHEFTKLMSKIIGGDALRERTNHACLAELAILKILEDRIGKKFTDQDLDEIIGELRTRRVCYIIDSLKHQEELKLLRSVYGDIFYSFSIFSPDKERRQNLLEKGLSQPEISRIINTDEFEDSKHGQNVRDTFVEADFFLRVSQQNESTIPMKVTRYLNILFESAVVTPTPNEIAMYEAKSAAGNSACLSRQVGAAITNSIGEIISRGWNDVPKFGGNLYKDGDEIDHRCFINGYCSNDRTKDSVTENILNCLIGNEELQEYLPQLSGVKTGDELYKKLESSIRRNSKIKDLIEFSRSVHAEMHAIIVGSQLAGSKMIGGKLFCTTYPCHNCARHIIVAGIKEIYFIEPYKKSLGIFLHDDAISEDEDCKTKTKILMFDGVAPRRYLEFFTQQSSRKDKVGNMILANKRDKKPKTRLTLQALPTLEIQSVHTLESFGLINYH